MRISHWEKFLFARMSLTGPVECLLERFYENFSLSLCMWVNIATGPDICICVGLRVWVCVCVCESWVL